MKTPEEMNKEIAPNALLFAALYLSEGWYEAWRSKGSLHGKARAMVLFDRAMSGKIGLRPQEAKP